MGKNVKMALQFVKKRILKAPDRVFEYNKKRTLPEAMPEAKVETAEKEPVEAPKPKNKKAKKVSEMDTMEKIAAAEAAIENMAAPSVKVVKTDRGLIERTESSKIILTEDNRQVLND